MSLCPISFYIVDPFNDKPVPAAKIKVYPGLKCTETLETDEYGKAETSSLYRIGSFLYVLVTKENYISRWEHISVPENQALPVTIHIWPLS